MPGALDLREVLDFVEYFIHDLRGIGLHQVGTQLIHPNEIFPGLLMGEVSFDAVGEVLAQHSLVGQEGGVAQETNGVSVGEEEVVSEEEVSQQKLQDALELHH